MVAGRHAVGTLPWWPSLPGLVNRIDVVRSHRRGHNFSMMLIRLSGSQLHAARVLAGLSLDDLAERAKLCRHSIRKWETSSDAVPGAMYPHLCRAVDDGEGARFSAMPTRGMSRSPNLRGSYNGSPLRCQVTSTSTA